MAAQKEVTTDEAFSLLVNNDYYWALTGLSHQTKRNKRFEQNRGKGLTIDKKEELLAKAGFTVKQEKTWNLPE